jgi:catalase-peroxidase
MAPHSHLEGEKVVPKMATTDLALRFGDEKYDEISRLFLEDFEYFTDVFARAWFKLTHRDMGPRARYHGPEVPEEVLIWQDPVPTGTPVSSEALERVEELLDESGLTTPALVRAAWASASTYRNTDKRGGANGARIALEPQRNWPINAEVNGIIDELKKIHAEVSDVISFADLIVYAGTYAVERAANASGVPTKLEFLSGRGDATQEQTDTESFNHLYPVADAFVNWSHAKYADSLDRMLVDKAALLGLTPPEMAVLYGGLRSLGVSTNNRGVFTRTPGILSNEFFKTILDMGIEWKPVSDSLYQGLNRKTKEPVENLIASRADLVFASNSVLRAYAEVYASEDGQEQLVRDFVAAWTKVMNADRFDI